MKRAIFILILLTVGVTLPPFYAQWAESQRLKQIQAVKQQARTVFGDRLETVLSKLESGEPPSLIVLYTGSTESHLEAVWMLSRTIRWASEARLRCGTDSAARSPDISGGCWRHL